MFDPRSNGVPNWILTLDVIILASCDIIVEQCENEYKFVCICFQMYFLVDTCLE